MQDDFCILSYERSIESIKSGRFAFEYTPVKLGDKDGEVILIIFHFEEKNLSYLLNIVQ